MKSRIVMIAAAAMAVMGAGTGAQARLPEAFSNLPKELVRRAVHLPTGCIAQVTVIDRRVVHADIVDPDCLPAGVRARPIPGQSRDFTIIDTAIDAAR